MKEANFVPFTFLSHFFKRHLRPTKPAMRFIISQTILTVFIAVIGIELKSQNVICAGVQFNTATLITPAPGCSAPYSYQISGSTGAVGIANTVTAATTYTPTGAGSFVVEVWSNGALCNSQTINVLDASFNINTSPGCLNYFVAINNFCPSCSYTLTVNNIAQQDFTGSGFNVTIPCGGNYNFNLTVTNPGGVECSSTQNLNVPGPNPVFGFQGDNFWNGTAPLFLNLPFATTFLEYPTLDTIVVPYCLSLAPGTTTFSFPLNITSISGMGSGLFTVYYDNNIIYGPSATEPLASDLILNTETAPGTHYIRIEIENGGCTYYRVYEIFMGQNTQSSFSVGLSTTPNSCSNIVYDFIPTGLFDQNGNPNFPPGTEFTWMISCNFSGGIWDTLHYVTWPDASLIPPVLQWTPNQSSCDCSTPLNSGVFTSLGNYSNPCKRNAIPTTSNFVINPAPEADFTLQPNYCAGTYSITPAQQLDVTCPITHIWTVTNPAGVSVNSFDEILNVNFNSPGQWTISHTVDAGVCGTDNMVLTTCVFPAVNAANLAININWNTPTSPICAPVNLTPSIISFNNTMCVGPTFTWRLYQLPNTTTAISTYNGLSPSFNLTAKGSYRIVLTATVENCGSITYEQDYIVIEPPVITLTSPSVACQNEQVQIGNYFCVNDCGSPINNFEIRMWPNAIANCSAATGGSVLYNNTNLPLDPNLDPCNLSSSTQYPWTVPANASGTYTFRITATNACGTTTDCFSIDVGTPISLNAPFPATVCQDSLLLLSTYSPTCTWYYDNGGVWTLIGNGANVYSQPITGPVTFKTECAGACPLVSTVDIFPSFTIELDATQNPVCSGNSVDIEAIADPLSAVITNYDFSGDFGNQSGTNDQFTIASINAAGQVTVVATDNHGCEATDIIDMQIAGGPTLTQNNFTFCESDNTPINIDALIQDAANGNNITDAQWVMTDSGNNSWNIPAATASIDVQAIVQQFGAILVPSESFNLDYIYADSQSGCTYTGTINIVIDALAQNNITEEVCVSEQINLLNAGNYQWTNAPSSAPTPVNGNTYSWTPQATDVANSPYELIYSNGCAATAITYNIHNIDINFAVLNDTICEGSDVTLSVNALPAGVYDYSWCQDNCATFTPGTDTYLDVEVGTSTTYTVQVSDAYCTIEASQLIVVETAPVFDTASIQNPYCETDSYLIDFAQMVMFDGVYPASAIQWMACGQILNNNGITVSNLSSACGGINSDSLIMVSYEITSNFGCVYRDTLNVEILNQGINITNTSYCSDLPVTIAQAQNGTWNYTALPASYNATVNGNDLSWTTSNSGGPYLITFNGDCSQYQYEITMRDFAIDLIADDTLICPGQSVNLSAQLQNTNSSGFTYDFTVNGTGIYTGLNNTIIDSPATGSTYTVDVVDVYGCVRTDEIDIAIDIAPTENIGFISGAYCETSLAATIELNDLLTSNNGTNITNAEWTICGSDITQNAITIAEIVDASLCGPVDSTPSDTSTFQLTYLYDNGNCSYNGSFDVNILDESEDTEYMTYCAGELIVLPGTGTWLPDPGLPSGAPATCSNCGFNWQTTIADSLNNAIIEYNDLNACGATYYDVTINPTPTLTAMSFDQICINIDSTLSFTTDQALASYFWIVASDSIAGDVFDPDGILLQPDETVPICIWGENNFGCENQDCFDVTVAGLPAPISIDADGIHCLDNLFQLPVLGNTDYEVDFETDQYTITYFEGDPFLFPENDTWNYTIELTSPAGCMDVQQGTIQVLDTPVAGISMDPYNNCAPIIAVNNNSTGDDASYSWTSDLITGELTTYEFSPNPLIVPVTAIDAFYLITFSIENSCGEATDQLSVYFQAPPVAYLSSDFSPNFNCSPQCGTIDADCPSTTTIDQVVYSWPGLIDMNTGQTSITTSGLADLPYVCFEVEDATETNIIVEITNACGSAVDSIPLIVIPPQVAAAFTITDEACPGDEIAIIDQSFPGIGAAIFYEVSPQGQGVFISDEVINILPTAVPGIYEITQTVEGCGTSSLTQTIVVHEAPVVALDEITEVFCTGETVAFSAGVSEFMELYWSFGDGFETIGYSDIAYIYENAGNYEVSVTGITPEGCYDTDFTEIIISGQDEMLIASDSIFCGNTLFNASPNADAWESLVWNIYPNPGIENLPAYVPEFNHLFLNDTDSLLRYTLTMTLTNGDGCGSYNELDITVKPSTTVGLSWNDRNDCEFPIDNSIVIEDYNPHWNYYYNIPDAENTYRSGSKIHGNFYSSQTILVTSLNEFGCSATATIDLACNEWPVYVPNAVTADHDGVNEYFKPIFSNEPYEYEFTIYNRWGDIVFYSVDPNEYWIVGDRSSNEYYVINDVYNWRLEYKAFSTTDKQEMLGHVTVVR